MRRTPRVLLVGVVLAVLVLAACSASSAGSGDGPSTKLVNLAFNPSSLNVKVGDTVTVKNADSVQYEVMIGTTYLGLLHSGDSATWKAPADGVYIMKCLVYKNVQGRITVGAGGSTIGTPPVVGE